MEKVALPEGSSDILKLYKRIVKRGFVASGALDDLHRDINTLEYLERELELRSADVFKSFYQNEYEAEKEFTRAFLKYYWGNIPKVISYLYNKKPY